MNIEEIEKKLEENTKRIIENSNRIEKNIQKINDNSNNIKHNSGAIDVLHTIKTYNNRFFFMWCLTFLALFISVIYNVLLLKDRNTIETITTQEVEQETDDGSNYYIGRDGEING